jgi:hypothetical protein
MNWIVLCRDSILKAKSERLLLFGFVNSFSFRPVSPLPPDQYLCFDINVAVIPQVIMFTDLFYLLRAGIFDFVLLKEVHAATTLPSSFQNLFSRVNPKNADIWTLSQCCKSLIKNEFSRFI